MCNEDFARLLRAFRLGGIRRLRRSQLRRRLLFRFFSRKSYLDGFLAYGRSRSAQRQIILALYRPKYARKLAIGAYNPNDPFGAFLWDSKINKHGDSNTIDRKL